MTWRTMHRISVLAAGLFVSTLCIAQEIVVTPQQPTGVYEVGQKIQWTIDIKGEGAGDVGEVGYILKNGGLKVLSQGKIALTAGSGTLETAATEPGTILAEIQATPPQPRKPIKVLAGAAIAPTKIQPSAPRPADFDAFWTAKIAELNAIPANAKLEPADGGKPNVEYFKVQMDNIRGSHIYGQLAKPKGEGKYPAMLIVQWAGVYGLPKSFVVGRAEAGWLTLNIMAHDEPFDRPDDYYKQLNQTKLNNYVAIGNNDRETSYFLRMYLSCYRAAKYLSHRPDWDGKVLVVTGGSQGGLQSIVTAAIHPKITALVANVPAGCDRTGPLVGRSAGWPGWWGNDTQEQKKILETSRYFDVVNFAPMVKCPALVALGLIDTTCPPAGVYAACNQFQGPKEILPMVNSGHGDIKGSQRDFYARSDAWFRALVKGQAAPVK